MKGRLMPFPRMIRWGDVFSFSLPWFIHYPFHPFSHNRFWLHYLSILQISAIEFYLHLPIKILSDLHFPSPQGNHRFFNEYLFASPLNGVPVSDPPIALDTENIS